MTSTLPRRLAAALAAGALMFAAVPAYARAHAHHPPRASTPPDRIAYVQRPDATTSSVPQRTAAI